VRVTVDACWPNCPRYVHRYEKVKESRYVPRAQCETPLAGWKRIDIVQPSLAAKDQGKADKAGGIITVRGLVRQGRTRQRGGLTAIAGGGYRAPPDSRRSGQTGAQPGRRGEFPPGPYSL